MTDPDPLRARTAAEKARRKRSLAIALGLTAFVVLVFVTTMVRLAQNTADARRNAPVHVPEGVVLGDG